MVRAEMRVNERASEQMEKKVPSAKMKIRIFYLLQDCYEYKFMFEYNIKMYNSHLIFVLCTRSHLYGTRTNTSKSNRTRRKKNQLKNLNSISVLLFHNQHIRVYVYGTVVIV